MAAVHACYKAALLDRHLPVSCVWSALSSALSPLPSLDSVSAERTVAALGQLS